MNAHNMQMICVLKKTGRLACMLIILLALFSSMAAGLLTYGKQNDDIYDMQLRLQQLGYFTGNADGYFGDDTVTAIMNFQTANGLNPTGLADPDTVLKIKSEDAVTKKAFIDQARNIQKLDLELKTGDSGKQVKQLQTLLQEKGYFKGDATGNYENQTETAVFLFQIVNHLSVTGIADSETISLLCAPGAIDLNKSDVKIVIQYGDSGSQVKFLQLKLLELGYFSGDCSAKFGKNTQDAVYEFQRRNGIAETGECDLDMRILLMTGKAVSYAEAIALEAVSELSEGDITHAVEKVKQQLTALGYYTGLIDTEFTHELTEAVYYFQLANGIQTTGSADKATRLLLNSGLCVTMDEFIKEMSEMPAMRDDAGHQVVLLQRRLLDLGYYLDSVNGSFDKKTEDAVKTFQKAHDLEETGIADADTRILMNSEQAYTYAEYIDLQELRQKEEMRLETVLALCEEAKKAVSLPYEAGRAGDGYYGNSGLTYAVYLTAGIELHPTIALQYESAKSLYGWNEDESLFEMGDQVFFYKGDTLLTGICVAENTIVFASPDHACVVMIEQFSEKSEYEFVGSIYYL